MIISALEKSSLSVVECKTLQSYFNICKQRCLSMNFENPKPEEISSELVHV